jgi:lipopolysaccharide export system protein LptA
MRKVRPVILLAIFAILAGLGATYFARLKLQAGSALAKPKALAPGTLATSHAWTYRQTTNGKMAITLNAQDLQEVEGKQELTGVELDIYHKEGNEYDHVKCAKAEFDMNQGVLYSDGDVEITMSVPVDKTPTGRLMVIKSSGVRVESKTGKAHTDRLATFEFDRGEGRGVGADYDPNTRELVMHSQVDLTWRGTDPKTVPMKVAAGEVTYKERDSKVFLSPWSKLTRDTMHLNAGPAVVTLVSGSIKLVETQDAVGGDQRPGRNLDYSAKQLRLDFDDNSQIVKITGVDQARLVSTQATTITTMTADAVVMDFDTSGDSSVLQTAVASGNSMVETNPVPAKDVELADTRILKSDTLRTKMRAGGQEIESVETDLPGSIEFIPNRPEQPHRWMNGDRVSMIYGPKNQIQSFRSVNVTTRTEKPKLPDAKETPAPEFTWSKDLLATFQPNSSQLGKLEQWGNFRYEAGERHAKAERAALDQPNDLIDLIGGARISDATGSADADKIQLNQMTGDFSAEGNVSSTRLPDKKKEDSGGMLSEDEPLHARAKKMSSMDNSQQIHYEGNAVLWQGANRLEADIVDIDRENSILKAHGHVISQLLDKADSPPAEADKAADKTKAATSKKSVPTPAKSATGPAKSTTTTPKSATNQAARVFTVVKAPELEYNDQTRVADYKDGVSLDRPNMKVKAREVHAFLRDNSDDSSLDHAFADGQVEIVQTALGRVRNGTSEHAEYYVDEDKVILEGGSPLFVDSLRGNTHGEKLTWFSKDDRLLVNGVETKPVKTVMHKKKK